MSTEIPTSPNEMPYDKNNRDRIYDIISNLSNYGCVDIHWENDEAASCKTGEPEGEWEVYIETRLGKRINSKHKNIKNALWFANTLAENADSESYQKQNLERKAALEKLTVREKALLGISR